MLPICRTMAWMRSYNFERQAAPDKPVILNPIRRAPNCAQGILLMVTTVALHALVQAGG